MPKMSDSERFLLQGLETELMLNATEEDLNSFDPQTKLPFLTELIDILAPVLVEWLVAVLRRKFPNVED